jgi:hypothetical protein
MKEFVRQEQAPQVVYKYLRRKHAESMLAKGCVRIGTLYEYRNVELHGPDLGDKDEGLWSGVDYVDRKERRIKATLSPPCRITLDVPGDKRLTDISVYATRHYIQFFEEWPDSYIYCISKVLDTKVMQAFNAEVAVQIHEPMEFFKVLTRHLRQRFGITAYFFGSCGYRKRIGSIQAPPWPLLFIKDPKYAYQREVRFAWLPPALPIHSVVIRCRTLTQFVSLAEDDATHKS